MNIWLKIGLLIIAASSVYYLLSSSEVRTLIEKSNGQSKQATLAAREPLAMTFAHQDHSTQQCVSCHHNYQDNSGNGLCLECHLTNPALEFALREQFHDLCIGCHINEALDEEGISGPVRSCTACHLRDERP